MKKNDTGQVVFVDPIGCCLYYSQLYIALVLKRIWNSKGTKKYFPSENLLPEDALHCTVHYM